MFHVSSRLQYGNEMTDREATRLTRNLGPVSHPATQNPSKYDERPSENDERPSEDDERPSRDCRRSSGDD